LGFSADKGYIFAIFCQLQPEPAWKNFSMDGPSASPSVLNKRWLMFTVLSGLICFLGGLALALLSQSGDLSSQKDE